MSDNDYLEAMKEAIAATKTVLKNTKKRLSSEILSKEEGNEIIQVINKNLNDLIKQKEDFEKKLKNSS